MVQKSEKLIKYDTLCNTRSVYNYRKCLIICVNSQKYF